MKTKAFSERIGAIRLPEAGIIPNRSEVGLTPDPRGPEPLPRLPTPRLRVPEGPWIDPPIWWPRPCLTTLREGCYTLSYRPKGSTLLGPYYRGTLRVEHQSDGHRISGDLYVRWLIVYPFPERVVAVRTEPWRRELRAEFEAEDAADTGGTIPIYPRNQYYSYLKGTDTQLFTFTSRGGTCWFGLTFDEFRYDHPASGFNGSFPTTPTRSVRFVLNHTTTPDFYTGKAYEGSDELGSVSIRWVSPNFRRASLEIHTLDGAEAPQPVTSGTVTENFRTIFETAGWDLTVSYAGTVSLPESLEGVQDPNTCWTPANSALLMESVPGYDPGELDSVWKAHLIAIPATMGCSRGRMFDNGSGDTNNVAREGAVTHSHDGYPSTDTCGSDYGTAEDEQQRNVPRAFLRSAAHEVGHTFNQIHQSFEDGTDNSIMTVTPCVAGVLDSAGLTFPDDINLGFNSTVRRHLIHLPDPAVRPGAMDFFSSAINAPEADQVAWLDELALEVKASESVRLGEPVSVSWKLTNTGESPIVAPVELDVNTLTARVSVTDASGDVTFMRPFELEVCAQPSLKRLEPGKSVEGSTVVFWGRDGFAFEKPGRHILEVIVMWQVGGIQCGAAAETVVSVAYPLTDKDNQIAALMLDEDVGRAVASGNVSRWGKAESRIGEVVKLQKTHPAAERLRKLDLAK